MVRLDETLTRLLGTSGWLTGQDAVSYQRDWLNRFGEAPLGVARPTSTDEVSAVLTSCAAARVPVVPQGGNTSLCGGAVAGRAGSVILSLARMARIGQPDAASASVEVEAGVVLARLHEALNGTGLMFPLHLGAEGSAQIGGLIGTNAGGSQAFRHGMMGDLVLGMEVVLADGRVWNGMRAVLKDNAGYQLRRLFSGAEGTLGIVTRAVLRLAPEPRQRATALLALPDFDALIAFGAMLRAEVGEFLAALEFFADVGLTLALRHVPGLVHPLETRAPVYLLVELGSGSARVPLEEIFGDVLGAGMEAGLVLDGALAASGAQRAAFWRLREEQPEGQRLEGPQLKHDISVPPGRIAEFLKAADVCCAQHQTGVRINPFGHLGDGNIHYNLSPPEGDPRFAMDPRELATALAEIAQSFDGSFAAEHGLGRAKISLAETLRDPVERALQSALKSALDPAGRLNPGVIVSSE